MGMWVYVCVYVNMVSVVVAEELKLKSKMAPTAQSRAKFHLSHHRLVRLGN